MLREGHNLLLFFLISIKLFSSNPGDTFFNSAIVHDINIVFSQPNFWDSLLLYKNTNDQNPEGSAIFLRGNVIIDGIPLNTSGVRLKGNSSFNHPGQKKPLKIKFDEFISGQEFDGLESIHLNNSSYDPTMLREKLFLDILNKHNLPAPRCTYARLSYNGSYVGLYKVIETIDKTFLKTWFNYKKGNLYKGDPTTPLKWEGANQSSYYDNFELKTNELLNDWTGLVNFINKVNSSPPGIFKQNMEQYFDVHTFLKIWAANNLFVNFDTYFINPHNFYLYDDSLSGKFRWISWDVGLAFGVYPSFWGKPAAETDILYLPNNPNDLPLSKNLYDVETYKKEYLSCVCELMYTDFVPGKLYRKIDSIAAVIRPYIYAEPDSNQMYTEAQFEGNLNYTSVPMFFLGGIPGIKSFIVERWNKVSGQFCKYNWSCITGNFYDINDENIATLYPNPSSEYIYVNFSVPEYYAALEYIIADMTGKTILHENIVLPHASLTQVINISSLTPGVYALFINAGCYDVRKKFIVIK